MSVPWPDTMRSFVRPRPDLRKSRSTPIAQCLVDSPLSVQLRWVVARGAIAPVVACGRSTDRGNGSCQQIVRCGVRARGERRRIRRGNFNGRLRPHEFPCRQTGRLAYEMRHERWPPVRCRARWPRSDRRCGPDQIVKRSRFHPCGVGR